MIILRLSICSKWINEQIYANCLMLRIDFVYGPIVYACFTSVNMPVVWSGAGIIYMLEECASMCSVYQFLSYNAYEDKLASLFRLILIRIPDLLDT